MGWPLTWNKEFILGCSFKKETNGFYFDQNQVELEENLKTMTLEKTFPWTGPQRTTYPINESLRVYTKLAKPAALFLSQ